MPEDRDTRGQGDGRVRPADPRLVKPEHMKTRALMSAAAAMAGSFALVIGLLWWLVSKTWGAGPKTLLIIGAVALLYALVANFGGLVTALKQRRIVSGLNTVVFAIAIFGILVTANIISVRHRFFRYDASKSKQFSLSEQTIKILKSLNQDVQAAAFFSPKYTDEQQIRDRLSEYAAQTPRFKVAFYDPRIQMDKVREFNVTMDGTVILKCGDKKEQVLSGDEERLTSALLAVSTGEKTKVYFLTGHGESNADDYGMDSVSAVKKVLEDDQYAVESLNLLNKPGAAIPTDCAALVIAGAKHPLQPAELSALEKYADQGGKLFIALANTPTAPDFETILSKRGVKPLKGKINDPNAEHNAGKPSIPAVLKPEAHDITSELQALVLPMARPLQIEAGPEPPPSYPGAPPPPSNKKAVELLKTSTEAWDDVADATGKFDEKKGGGEASGPFAMAAAIDESKKEEPPQQPGMPPPPQAGPATGTRIIVVGDSEFMTDRLVMDPPEGYGVWANKYLAKKGVAWLLSNEKLISIPPKQTEAPYSTMVGAQKAISAVVALIVLPGLIMFTGGIVWWRRRR